MSVIVEQVCDDSVNWWIVAQCSRCVFCEFTFQVFFYVLSFHNINIKKWIPFRNHEGCRSSMTATSVFSAFSGKSGLKTVKNVVGSCMERGASELKKTIAFKFGGCFNFKLKKKPATVLAKK